MGGQGVEDGRVVEDGGVGVEGGDGGLRRGAFPIFEISPIWRISNLKILRF